MITEATYSVEDNKLRLYASARLDEALYKRVRDAGFRWAPKQELFVAPKWTPAREDLAIELAGDIEPEGTTLAERAEAKAARYEELAQKRANDFNAFRRASDDLSRAFEGGQPILVGHHSERKARKTQERMHNYERKAAKAWSAIDYWNYKADGAEYHANMKNSPGVRSRRIKTLLAELRDLQRTLNHAALRLKIWEKADPTDLDHIKRLAGGRIETGSLASFDCWSDLDAEKITAEECRERNLRLASRALNSDNLRRWIDHTLKRLGYERSMLGHTARFDGKLTPVVLQAFARTHGAHKPKAEKTDGGFVIKSIAPLPLHIASGNETELTEDGWRDLMQGSGYEVPETKRRAPKKQTAPLINPTKEDAERLQALWNADARGRIEKKRLGSFTEQSVYEMPQAHYSANSSGSYSAFKTINIDAQGRRIWPSAGEKRPVAFRLRRASCGGSGFFDADRVIRITDKPAKALPIDWEAEEPQAEEAA